MGTTRHPTTRLWGRLLGVGLAAGLSTASVSVLPAQVARAGTTALHVTNCNDAGSGSLRAAVGTSSVTTIVFDTPCPVITLTSGPLNVTTNLTINGPGANVLAVSGSQCCTVFAVSSGLSVTIKGLTVENGSNYYGAGGIENDGTLVLANSTVSNNASVVSAGGIENDGTLILANSTVSNNLSYAAGGILNRGTLIVSNSTLSSNRSRYEGGAIVNQQGTVFLSNSTVSNNSVDYPAAPGGGIYNNATGTLTVRNSTFSDNPGGYNVEPGVYSAGTFTTRNSTFT